jgi:RNA polymerase sigma factor (TIGR02999 family)
MTNRESPAAADVDVTPPPLPRESARLLPLVYAELRRLAGRHMRGEPAGHTLQPTALVHEAYARLAATQPDVRWDGPGHFYAAAAEAMRRILIERARRRSRLKHGGGRNRVATDGIEAMDEIGRDEACDPASTLWVDEVLTRLEQMDPRLAELVKLRCFLGMDVAETAAAMGVSSRTVNREWLVAKAWLRKEWGTGTRG